MPLSLISAQQIAARWQTSPRTVYRWFARGVDVSNPAEVLQAIIAAPNPTMAMLEAATRETLALNEVALERITQPEPLP